jgi:hypothetical protein
MNVFSRARWLCRMTTSSWRRHRRKWTTNWLYCQPSGCASLYSSHRLQRHPLAPELLVDLHPVRDRPTLRQRRLLEQTCLQGGVIHVRRQGPTQTRRLGTLQVVRDSAVWQPTRSPTCRRANPPATSRSTSLILRMAARGRGIGGSSNVGYDARELPCPQALTLPPWPPTQGDRKPRNADRIRPEWVIGLPRNTQR